MRLSGASGRGIVAEVVGDLPSDLGRARLRGKGGVWVRTRRTPPVQCPVFRGGCARGGRWMVRSAVREPLAGAAGEEDRDGAGRCEEDIHSQHKRILYNLLVLSYYIYTLLI